MDTLVDQNSDLIQTVVDIEREACLKLSQLEDTVRKQQLRHTANGSKELESDLNNMVELVRRARENGKWDASGLAFYSVDPEEILGSFATVNQQ